jgi:hypothetical protein
MTDLSNTKEDAYHANSKELAETYITPRSRGSIADGIQKTSTNGHNEAHVLATVTPIN